MQSRPVHEELKKGTKTLRKPYSRFLGWVLSRGRNEIGVKGKIGLGTGRTRSVCLDGVGYVELGVRT